MCGARACREAVAECAAVDAARAVGRDNPSLNHLCTTKPIRQSSGDKQPTKRGHVCGMAAVGTWPVCSSCLHSPSYVSPLLRVSFPRPCRSPCIQSPMYSPLPSEQLPLPWRRPLIQVPSKLVPSAASYLPTTTRAQST